MEEMPEHQDDKRTESQQKNRAVSEEEQPGYFLYALLPQQTALADFLKPAYLTNRESTNRTMITVIPMTAVMPVWHL